MSRRFFSIVAASLAVASGAGPVSAQPNQPGPVPAQPVSARYFCPMKCEGAKTYDAPGKCPVCLMNLKPVPTGPSLTIKPESALAAGEPARLTLAIKDAAGQTPKGIGSSPVHIVMVSRDLSWFAHDQPKAESDGTVRTAQKFPPGEYVLFATYAPAPDSPAFVTAPLSIPGKPPIVKAMGVDADRPKTVEGITATLDGHRGIRAGRDATITFRLTSGDKPADTLKPQSGSDHLTAVSQDLKQVVHADPARGTPPSEPTFTLRLDRPGLYRLWGEFRIGEKTLLFPFVVEASPATEGK